MTKQTTKTPRTFKPKACAKCSEQFTPTGGRTKYCSPCDTEVKREQKRTRDRRYRANNPEKVRESARKRSEQNRERSREWRENNAERHRELIRRWKQENPERHLEHNRRSRKKYPDREAARAGKATAVSRAGLSCIPSGFTIASTIPFYKRARALTRSTSVQFHVDHIIPLARGGLHCPSNLQVITAAENIAKGDKLPSELENAPVQLDLELV